MRGPAWVVLLFAVFSAYSAPARAQDAVFDRARIAIGRTDERIEQARASVAESRIELARTELEAASRLQGQAKRALEDQHPRMAINLTLRARFRAQRSIGLVEGLADPEAIDPVRIGEQLERSRALIEQTRGAIDRCSREEPRSLFGAAVEMQRRAETAFETDRYLAALQLTTGARERVLRASRLCEGPRSDPPPAQPDPLLPSHRNCSAPMMFWRGRATVVGRFVRRARTRCSSARTRSSRRPTPSFAPATFRSPGVSRAMRARSRCGRHGSRAGAGDAAL